MNIIALHKQNKKDKRKNTLRKIAEAKKAYEKRKLNK